ncbi:hypothetical protein MHBO_001937 [Bonamia ostreae]|uniref:Uncharacterized protein n=1 Tax=Bonamia ostreae TaxID=126728 RepID=A0ABV2AKN2_9EUKA
MLISLFNDWVNAALSTLEDLLRTNLYSKIGKRRNSELREKSELRMLRRKFRQIERKCLEPTTFDYKADLQTVSDILFRLKGEDHLKLARFFLRDIKGSEQMCMRRMQARLRDSLFRYYHQKMSYEKFK